MRRASITRGVDSDLDRMFPAVVHSGNRLVCLLDAGLLNKNPVSSMTRNGVPIIPPNFPYTLGIKKRVILALTFIGITVA